MLPAGSDVAQIQAKLLRGASTEDAFAAAQANYLFRDLNGDGRQTRDYIDVSDVVSANLAAMQSREDEGVFNIGTGRQVDVNTIFGLLRRSLGSDVEAAHGPGKPEQRTSALDSSLAAHKLEWRPRVELESGIAATADWFRGHR